MKWDAMIDSLAKKNYTKQSERLKEFKTGLMNRIRSDLRISPWFYAFSVTGIGFFIVLAIDLYRRYNITPVQKEANKRSNLGNLLNHEAKTKVR